MYREEILDHYKRPRNTGTLETEFEAQGANKSCGDNVSVYLRLDDGCIQEMKHKTEGCAICTAATSILSEEVAGMEIAKIEEIDTDWMLDKLDIDVSPMRMKCAVLGLKTAQKAIDQD